MSRQRAIALGAALVLCLALAGGVLAMSSAGYRLPWSMASSGGGHRTAPNFAVVDVAGQPVAGASASAGYRLVAGYWGGPAQVTPPSGYALPRRVFSAGGGERTSPQFRLADTLGQPGAGRMNSASFALGAGFWSGMAGAIPPRHPLPGDANEDGKVDGHDLVIVTSAFNTAPPGDTRSDINGDNLVNIFDLALVGMSFGQSGAADDVPPTTLPTVDPPPGATGWNNSNVTVTLQASDNPGGSGVAAIHFRIDGGGDQAVSGDTAMVTIDTEGMHTLTYQAEDNAGNSEAEIPLAINIDWTPPTIQILSPVPRPYMPGEMVLIDYDVSDGLSGVMQQSADLGGMPVQDGDMVMLPGFPGYPGTVMFNVNASDGAGNVGMGYVTLEITGGGPPPGDGGPPPGGGGP